MKVAVVQMQSGQDVVENMTKLKSATLQAAKEGARLVAFPENALFMAPNDYPNPPCFDNPGEESQQLQALADACDIEILVGSVPERCQVADKHFNSSWFIAPQAGRPHSTLSAQLISYHKIHLFDVQLQNGESYHESDKVVAGSQAQCQQTRIGKIGLTICYDLRFPELYRHLQRLGAEIMAVPAAFTYETGKEHWHCLLRARAIENLAYVIAPAQCGSAYPGRRCYGHSMIIDPWGQTLSEASLAEEEILYADIDLDYQRYIRQQFPALQHRKLFTEA